MAWYKEMYSKMRIAQNVQFMWLLTGGGHLQELRQYWLKNFALLAYGNCRDLFY